MLLGRIFARGVVLSVLCVAGAEACSSDDKPPSSGGSSGSGPIGGGSTSSGSTPGVDAASNGTVDGGSPTDGATPTTDGRVCVGDSTATDAAAGSACPASGECAAPCAKVAANYRLGIALATGECLKKLASCNPDNVAPCIDHTVLDVCPDPTAKAYCEAFVLRCDPDAGGIGAAISEDGCEELASSLNETGRTTFRGCIETAIEAGTCRQNVVKCVQQLRL